MQTSQPSSLTAILDAAGPIEAVPYWLRLGIGFVLIGIAASQTTTAFRAAFPPAQSLAAQRMHLFYPLILGMMFSEAAPFALPGFGYDSRWLIGIVSPYLWKYVYTYIKEAEEAKLGVTLPSAEAILSGDGGLPASTTKVGGTS